MAFAWHCTQRGGRGIGMVRGRDREKKRGRELVLTCRSVRSRLAAISILLGRHKYLLKWNSFSSSSSCVLVYAVRRRRGRPFSGTNSAAIENCISCLSLAVNVNLDLAPPPPPLLTRLDASSAVDKLHSLGFRLGVSESHCRSWAKSMLDRLMHCLNFAYGVTSAASHLPPNHKLNSNPQPKPCNPIHQLVTDHN